MVVRKEYRVVNFALFRKCGIVLLATQLVFFFFILRFVYSTDLRFFFLSYCRNAEVVLSFFTLMSSLEAAKRQFDETLAAVQRAEEQLEEARNQHEAAKQQLASLSLSDSFASFPEAHALA